MKQSKSSMIVITGVTKGLGRALCEGFNELGHTVVGCGRSLNEIEKLNHLYQAHQFDVVDLSNNQQVQTWAKKVIEKWGSPDFLVNNAAIMNQPLPLWKISEEEFIKLTDININGVVRTIRVFLPAMIQQKKGIIVNFSSGWGRSTSPEVVPYCTSKWAIEGLSQGLAQEVPNGIGIIALNPGIINTEMLQTCWPDNASMFESPLQWSKKAIPFILKLTAKNNGQSLTVQ
ncbi:SDR family oxidoreductase [Crocosphaera watsonii]|uniref:Short chain dehydrogenase n=4 Tax=Crocosphaera watsonii TaxID=263511 RepID=T2IE45_CROWT|nr:SDR family oxidoreductase [Crocosphaera watsonii]CCQ51801.1 Short chain dehydrogenase [Crocosphaera watsonii WH 8502]